MGRKFRVKNIDYNEENEISANGQRDREICRLWVRAPYFTLFIFLSKSKGGYFK